MFTQQAKAAAFVFAAALFSLSSADATLAAGKLGVGKPKLHQNTLVQAREIQVAATGDGPATEADCKKYEAGINSWGDAALETLQAGDEEGNRTANRNLQGLIDTATDNGCFVIY